MQFVDQGIKVVSFNATEALNKSCNLITLLPPNALVFFFF